MDVSFSVVGREGVFAWCTVTNLLVEKQGSPVDGGKWFFMDGF